MKYTIKSLESKTSSGGKPFLKVITECGKAMTCWNKVDSAIMKGGEGRVFDFDTQEKDGYLTIKDVYTCNQPGATGQFINNAPAEKTSKAEVTEARPMGSMLSPTSTSIVAQVILKEASNYVCAKIKASALPGEKLDYGVLLTHAINELTGGYFLAVNNLQAGT